MNELLASHPLLTALGWTLIHFVWQACVVGLMCAIGLSILRSAKPQLRYVVLNIAMLAAVFWLLLTFVQHWQANPVAIGTQSAFSSGMAETVLPQNLDRLQIYAQVMMPYFLAIWFVGVSLLALRFVLGLWWLQGYGRDTRSFFDRDLQLRVDRLCAAFAMHSKVVVRIVDDLTGPITVGCFRPLILIPSSLLTGMAPAQLEALLAHELAHIRRYDFLLNLLQNLVEIILFFHPVVWWISKKIRDERENIADDLAVQVIGEPRRLALALQELERLQFIQSQLALAAHGGNLMLRIKRLVRPETHSMHWKTAVTTVGLASVFVALAAQAVTATPVATPSNSESRNAEVGAIETTVQDQRKVPGPDSSKENNVEPQSGPQKEQKTKKKETVAATQPQELVRAYVDFSKNGCKPDYPRASMRNEETGTSSLNIRVSNTGKILGVDIVKSSGFSNLDSALVERLTSGTCRATPGYKGSTKVETYARVDYVWKLD